MKFIEHLKTRMRSHQTSVLLINGGLLKIDLEAEVATFLVYNPFNGKLCGYQQYDPAKSKDKRNDEKGRYYLYTNKEHCFWVAAPIDRSKPLYLVEGIWDAVALIDAGFQAIAVLSNNPKPLKQYLNLIHDNKIAVCDNDAAGMKLSKYSDGTSIICTHKDPGDMTREEIINMLTGDDTVH